MGAGSKQGLSRAVRTLLQLVAAGGLTAIVDRIAGGLSPFTATWLMIGWTAVVSYAHNYLEAAGIVPTLLPTNVPPASAVLEPSPDPRPGVVAHPLIVDPTLPAREGRRLGKGPKREDPRTFKLARYVAGLLPKTPPTVRRSPAVPSWPMYLNDRIGDCTCAEIGHHLQLWTAEVGSPVTLGDSDILAAYEAVSGYNPKTGAHDDGAVILDVMRYWRKTGVAYHRIAAFAEVEPNNHALVKAGVWLFGGLSVGVSLPIAAQSMGTTWSLARNAGTSGKWKPGSWGGHCVYAVDYDRTGVTVVSWGELIKVSWGFWNRYVDECWAALSQEWLRSGKTVDGFDWQALNADLTQVGQAK